MRPTMLQSVLSVLNILMSSSPVSANWGYFQSQGQTKLLGTSFGLPGTDATFDYVVVGGGTSGAVVAKRLVDAGHSVAIVEAGSFYELAGGNYSQIPAYDIYFSSTNPLAPTNPLIDWEIITTPQVGYGNRTLHYTQGKCLGGSSARNYLAYMRGTKGSFQQWVDITGDSTYTWSNLLPYFNRGITFTKPNYAKRNGGDPVVYDASAFSQSSGPLHVSFSNYWFPISSYFQKAFEAIGIENIPGLNSGELIGYAEATCTIDPASGTRSDSETAYLRQAIEENNSLLQLYHQTLAKRILFNGTAAVGVNVTTAGIPYTLFATKEVVVAAGAFRSPQLLMVSGVGPSSQLTALDIPVVADLPGVGQGLVDQPLLGVTYKTTIETQMQLYNGNTTYLAAAQEAFSRNQSGPMTNSAVNLIGFEKISTIPDLRAGLSNSTLTFLQSFPADMPEIEVLPLPSTFDAVTTQENYFESSIALMTTSSRGSVFIKSSDTGDNPIVDPAWLSTKVDQELAIASVKRARQLAQAISSIIIEEYTPGPTVQTDEQILSFIKSNALTIHHAAGTCAMGRANDSMAVVDSAGRVMGGVVGLRVVDASTFPTLPPGHPQGIVYMLAEKLSSDIINGR